MLAVALVACEKNDEEAKAKLEATITLAEGVEAAIAEGVAYGQPIAVQGRVSTTDALTEVVLTGVAKSGESYVAKGSAQTLEQKGIEVDHLWFADTKEATHLEVKLVASVKSVAFYFPLGAVEGEWNYGAWTEPTAVLMADNKIANNANSPDLYPTANTGAGSDTKSFISMNGVEVNGERKHILSLNELLPVDGAGTSFCWANVYQNTTNNITLGSQRGYVLCDVPTLTAGTIGRQCDVYKYGEHFLNKANCPPADLSRIVGSWAGEDYDEEEYRFVDALFLSIPEEVETLADQMRAFYQLGEIQRVLDNSTLGVEVEPTTLTNANMYRQFTDAGNGISSENFRAGDYIIMHTENKVGEQTVYTYGIIQIVQLYDVSKHIITNEDGKQFIDPNQTESLFKQPCYFNIKSQMIVTK